MARRKTRLPRNSPIRRGIQALYERNLPAALEAFTQAYQSPKWLIRDIAITGLGDILDTRIPEFDKRPASSLTAGWEPSRAVDTDKLYITNERWLVLLESFIQASRWHPQNIAEKNTLHAMREAFDMLQQILRHDKHALVRFGAFLILTEGLDESYHDYIVSALEQAHRYEKNKLLKIVLERHLNEYK